MEYYSTIKNKDIINFAGKWMEVENIIPPPKKKQKKKNTECP
jgi:hypothetical protein